MAGLQIMKKSSQREFKDSFRILLQTNKLTN